MNEYKVPLATSFTHKMKLNGDARVHKIAYLSEHNHFLMPIIGAGVGTIHLPDLIAL